MCAMIASFVWFRVCQIVSVISSVWKPVDEALRHQIVIGISSAAD
jgi:hypothetical protein